MNAVELLQGAIERIVRPNAFRVGGYARDAYGRACDPASSEAVQWDLTGALHAEAKEPMWADGKLSPDLEAAQVALYKACGAVPRAWCDRRNPSVGQAVDVLRAAIRFVRAGEKRTAE